MGGGGYSDEREEKMADCPEAHEVCEKRVELKVARLVQRFCENGKLQIDQSVCSECFIKLLKAIDEPCEDLRNQKKALTDCLLNLELSLQSHVK